MSSDTWVDVQRPKTLGCGCCFIQNTGKPTLTEKSLQDAWSRIKMKIFNGNFSFPSLPTWWRMAACFVVDSVMYNTNNPSEDL